MLGNRYLKFILERFGSQNIYVQQWSQSVMANISFGKSKGKILAYCSLCKPLGNSSYFLFPWLPPVIFHSVLFRASFSSLLLSSFLLHSNFTPFTINISTKLRLWGFQRTALDRTIPRVPDSKRRSLSIEGSPRKRITASFKGSSAAASPVHEGESIGDEKGKVLESFNLSFRLTICLHLSSLGFQMSCLFSWFSK